MLVVDDDADSNEVGPELLAVGRGGRPHGGVGREAMDIAGALDARRRGQRHRDAGRGRLRAPRRRARAGAPLGAVPAIALTAYSAPSDREQALSAGFSAHVAKPVRTADLMGAVLAARSTGARYH